MVNLVLDFNPLENAKDYKIPDLNNAFIKKYYSEIKSDWDLGIQAVTSDNKIFSRIYKQLRFYNNPEIRFYEVTLGRNNEFYESDRYWVLANNFCEDTYSSGISYIDSKEDFLRWELYSNIIRQEIHYSPKKIGEYNWIRQIPIPTLNSINNFTFSELEENEYAASIDIKPNYKFIVDSKNAVKGKVTVEDNYKIEINLLSRDKKEKVKVNVNQQFILIHPLVEITVIELNEFEKSNPYKELFPKKIKIQWYGEEKLRTFLPSFQEKEVENLIHPISYTLEQRLKPPGLNNLPDNFWNSEKNPIIIKN